MRRRNGASRLGVGREGSEGTMQSDGFPGKLAPQPTRLSAVGIGSGIDGGGRHTRSLLGWIAFPDGKSIGATGEARIVQRLCRS
jgi:hypothetical protein